MTYNEFKKKYNGKYVDYDGQYGRQCWDLVAYYCEEVLKVPVWVISDYTHVENLLNSGYFEEVPTNKMNGGEICIWPSAPHICIFDHWDGKQCWWFSQDANARPCGVYNVVTNMSLPMRAFKKKETKPAPTPEPTPKPEPKPTPTPLGFKVGDTVVPTKLVSYDGIPLAQWDPSYTISEINGDRAVLMARGQVWCAMNTKDIRKI